MSYLKIIITIFIVSGIIGSSFFLNSKKIATAPAQENKNSTDKINLGETPNPFRDEDGDGLLNWKEDLLKTDKNNSDTDLDGTSDGDEVSQNRDPNKKPPDTLEFTSAKSILEKFPSEITKNIPTTKNSPQISNPTSKLPSISTTNTALKGYGNTLGALLIEDDRKNRAFEYEVFGKLIGNPKSEDFEALLKIMANYKALFEQVESIVPPENAKKTNQTLILALKNHAGSLQGLASYKESGIIPISAWKSYTETAIKIGEAYFNAALFFKENGIFFEASESGSIFNLPSE